jgi:hypothetical protein
LVDLLRGLGGLGLTEGADLLPIKRHSFVILLDLVEDPPPGRHIRDAVYGCV